MEGTFYRTHLISVWNYFLLGLKERSYVENYNRIYMEHSVLACQKMHLFIAIFMPNNTIQQ